jgi:hypothetical protein
MPNSFMRCAGCGESIGKGNLHLGEEVQRADETVHVLRHLMCAASERPEALNAALDAHPTLEIPNRPELEERIADAFAERRA